MADGKGPDEKIIFLPVSCLYITGTMTLKEYQDLEKMKVAVGGWGAAAEAKEIINECIERYKITKVIKKNLDYR